MNQHQENTQSNPTEPETIKACFVLLPGFALTSFSLALESLYVANKFGGTYQYDIHICHVESKTDIITDTGVPIAATSELSACMDADMVFVCAYENAYDHHFPKLKIYLDSVYANGAMLISLTSGSFIFARYGYLHDLSCTIVNEQAALFKEMYPNIQVQDNLYSVNGKILSCVGGTSALDMMLYVIAQHSGYDFISRISQEFLQEYRRDQDQTQNSIRLLAYRMRSSCLGAAIEVMQENISVPCSIATLAEKIGTTTRTLETTFKKHEGITPSQFYLRLRLEKAYYLVTTSLLPISQISLACGFSSQSHFGRCFKAQYEKPPKTLRLELLNSK